MVDHSFDHLASRTTWKQCEREHPKASFSDSKVLKSLVNQGKIGADLFGTSMPQIRILSLRPHENNPNILLLGEAFGLFVLFEYPNFNSKK